jgi:tyrosyl-tRNA synthetase
MRQFQDLGHKAILIIGDFTAMIGDPSGRNKTRPQLTMEETRINGQSYLEQATMILSRDSLEVRYNSEWLTKMNFNEVINLAAKYTVAQILERDDFNERYRTGTPISIHELLYPLAQAYDSVAIESDVELGGTDQKFNLLVGREIQRAFGKEPQCILTMPILEGTDGVEKMSKSLDNYIALTEPPREIFGKVMSIPDNLIIRYYRYAALASENDIKNMEAGLNNGTIHPRDAKAKTAMQVVKLYHGKQAAIAAMEEFDRIFKQKDLPDEIEEKVIDVNDIIFESRSDNNRNSISTIQNKEDIILPVADILVLSGLVPSKNQARRLIEQGGVYIDGERINDQFEAIDISSFRLFKVGKRKFLKVKAGKK